MYIMLFYAAALRQADNQFYGNFLAHTLLSKLNQTLGCLA
jgi:hypothetical protein